MRHALALGLLVGLAAVGPGLAAARSPLVGQLNAVATRYHEDPAQLDALRDGLEGAVRDEPDAANFTALSRVSFLLVLHHCAKPAAVLDEAARVTRHRLVVTESVYRSRSELFWLRLLDPRVNRRRHGGGMPPAASFHPAPEWEALFDSRGLRRLATRWLGSPLERLVHHPLLWVLAPSRGADRLHDLVSPGRRLAEAAERVGRQTGVDLVQPAIDLTVGQGEQAAAPAIAFHQEGAEALHLQYPQRLGDTEVAQPVHVEHARDAAAVSGAKTVADGGEIDGPVRDEPLAIG